MPTSPAQERLLILDRLGETGAGVQLSAGVPGPRRTGPRRAARSAVGDVVDRHESLRTVFAEHDGSSRPGHPAGRHRSAGAASSTATRHRCRGRDRRRRCAPLRPELGDPAAGHRVPGRRRRPHGRRCSCTTSPPTSGRTRRSCADLDRAYRTRTSGGARPRSPALPVQYADYTLWQRELLADVGEQQLQFWRETLAGAPDELTLPTDRPRPSRPSGVGGTVHVELPAETAAALRTLAARAPGQHADGAARGASPRCCTGSVQATTSSSARRSRAAARPRSTRWSASSSTPSCCGPTCRATRPSTSCWPGSAATDLAAFAHQDLPVRARRRGR